MGVKPLLCVGVGVLVLGVLLHIVAMATPAWSVGRLVEVGAWRECTRTVGCSSKKWGISDGFDAVRVLNILGVVLGIASAVTASVTLMLGCMFNRLVLGIVMKDKIKVLSMAAGASGLAAAGCSMLGLIIWAAHVQPDYYTGSDLGYSWGLGCVAVVFFAAGGVITFIGGP